MKKLIILFLFIFSNFGFCQRNTVVWYFGVNAGIDFKNITPQLLTNGKLSSIEGCASFCDSNKNLIFYTNGVTVWNSKHQIMVNGRDLMGDPHATNSAVIIQKPGSDSIYYIFTLDKEGDKKGFRYSTVDMSRQGGLGEVVYKNMLVLTDVTEKLAIVQHSNENDYWIIVHKLGSNDFYSYILNKNGLDTSKFLISSVGTTHINNGVDKDVSGYMKSSYDGKKLAVNVYLGELIEIFDFDRSNGAISNPISISTSQGPDKNSPYGLEFSPDQSKLYVTFDIPDGSTLHQYDLKAGNADKIKKSAVLLKKSIQRTLGAIQIGATQKLYVAQDYNYLAVIDKPDAMGTLCNYIEDGVALGGNYCKKGLPSFLPQLFYRGLEISVDSVICFGDDLIFYVKKQKEINYRWTGPNGFVTDTPSFVIRNAKYEQAGVYRLVRWDEWGWADTVYVNVLVNKTPLVVTNQTEFVKDTIYLDNEITRTFRLLNEENSDIIIDTFYFDNNKFQITSNLKYPLVIKPHEYFNLDIRFKPDNIGLTADFLRNKSPNTCVENSLFWIPAYAKTKLHIWFPDTVADYGIEDFKLRMFGKFLASTPYSTEVDFSALLNFNIKSFFPDQNKSQNVSSIAINNLLCSVAFKGIATVNSMSSLQLAYINGYTLFSDMNEIPLKPDSLIVNNEFIEVIADTGMLRVKSVCGSNINLLKKIRYDSLCVLSYPESDKQEIVVNSYNSGDYCVEVFNSIGDRMFSNTWFSNNTSNMKSEKRFELSSINNSGVYFILLKSPAGFVTEKFYRLK